MVIFPPSVESNKGEIAGCFNFIEFIFKFSSGYFILVPVEKES